MSDYLQPDFYRFNEDSIKLARYVKQNVKSAESILDLGAGSGVIGLEVSEAFSESFFHFVELQEEFLPYLEKNTSHLRKEISIESFGKFQANNRFDLIVCNPPYYLPGKGQPSQNPLRDRARTFREEGWEILLDCIGRNLNPSGLALVVIKTDEIILNVVRKSLPNNLALKEVSLGDITILELVVIGYK